MRFPAGRSVFTLCAVACLVAAVARCSDSVDNPGGNTTPGGKTPCASDSECGYPDNVCRGGFCESNTCRSNADCPGGTCNILSGTCTAGSPDGGGIVETPDGGGTTVTACTTKYDCPNGKICKGTPKACVDPNPANTCGNDSDCPRGKICNFSRQCEAGCMPGTGGAPSPDCDAPLLCDPQKYVCAACSLSNPCPAGKTCNSGACEDVITCNDVAPCKAQRDGLVCLPGAGGTKYCGNCTSHADCDQYKTGIGTPEGRICGADGLCKKATGCTSNGDCAQQFGELGYCDTSIANPVCKQYQCVRDGNCTDAATPVCDLAAHACVATPTGCDQQACQDGCAQQGATCNLATCSCATTPGSGTEGSPCTTSADCGTGMTCGLGICTAMAVNSDGSPCDSLTCALGSCVSASDGHTCDQMMCLIGALMGLLGGGGGGGGQQCTTDADCPIDPATGVNAVCNAMIPGSPGTCAGGNPSEAASCL